METVLKKITDFKKRSFQPQLFSSVNRGGKHIFQSKTKRHGVARSWFAPLWLHWPGHSLRAASAWEVPVLPFTHQFLRYPSQGPLIVFMALAQSDLIILFQDFLDDCPFMTPVWAQKHTDLVCSLLNSVCSEQSLVLADTICSVRQKWEKKNQTISDVRCLWQLDDSGSGMSDWKTLCRHLSSRS